MLPEVNFAVAVLAGLLGSSHCLGMCGGIVAALNLGLEGKRKNCSLLSFQLSYNLGRICSYATIGLLAGTLGAGLTDIGIAAWVGRLVAATFMIALGLYLANWWRGLVIFERIGFWLWL